jgi:hypothetical protein
MLPTPDFPLHEYEAARSRHVAHMRAAVAATIIFLVCLFVIAAHV